MPVDKLTKREIAEAGFRVHDAVRLNLAVGLEGRNDARTDRKDMTEEGSRDIGYFEHSSQSFLQNLNIIIGNLGDDVKRSRAL